MKKKSEGKWNGPHEAHSMGGKSSSAKMTREQRIVRARKAVLARWAKHGLKKAA